MQKVNFLLAALQYNQKIIWDKLPNTLKAIIEAMAKRLKSQKTLVTISYFDFVF